MKKLATIFAAIAIVATTLLAPVAVFADSDICNSEHIDKTSEAYKALCANKKEEDAQGVVSSILSTVFVWTSIIAVIVIIIGGIFYITSQGDPGKVSRAKNTILYAVIGLIVSLLAFAIVNFVLKAVGA